MGTVGLSFGSASSGAGFDVPSTVTSILDIQRGVETPWKAQLAQLQAQDAVLTTLGSGLASLTTKLQALTDFNGVLAQKEGASSDTNVLALSRATASAIAGNHDITVQRLAQTSSAFASAVRASDVLSGSISIQVGSGAPQTVDVDTVHNTASGLAAAINAAGIGVTASVLQDASGARLSIVSRTSGAAGQLTVVNSIANESAGSSVDIVAGHAGQDAELVVDGVSLTSSSNTVSNALPGVTFQLLNVSTHAVQVQITNDDSAVTSAMNDFVGAYNSVVTTLSSQEGKAAGGLAKPLYGDRTVAFLQGELASAVFGGSASGAIASLTQVGVTLAKDGTLSFSAQDFASALETSFGDMTGFLQNAGSFGNNFSHVLSGLGADTSQGAVFLAQQQNYSQESTLTKNISNQEARIATQKTALTKELNAANQILQGIPSQLNQVSELYNAITGYTK